MFTVPVKDGLAEGIMSEVLAKLAILVPLILFKLDIVPPVPKFKVNATPLATIELFCNVNF